jgi:hypothetical protein
MLTTWHPLSEKVGTTLTSGGRLVGIVHSWTQATESMMLISQWLKLAAGKLLVDSVMQTFS